MLASSPSRMSIAISDSLAARPPGTTPRPRANGEQERLEALNRCPRRVLELKDNTVIVVLGASGDLPRKRLYDLSRSSPPCAPAPAGKC